MNNLPLNTAMAPAYALGHAAGLSNGSVYDNPWFGKNADQGRHWIDGLVAGWRDGGHISTTTEDTCMQQ